MVPTDYDDTLPDKFKSLNHCGEHLSLHWIDIHKNNTGSYFFPCEVELDSPFRLFYHDILEALRKY